VREYASTSHTVRVLDLGREEVADRVVIWWHVYVYAALAPPLIFIEHANDLLNHRLISTLIRLGSNILWTLIQIFMIVSWSHRGHKTHIFRFVLKNIYILLKLVKFIEITN
jgi:hypothetical protein